MLYQPPPKSAQIDPDITLNGNRLSLVNHFTYFGSTNSLEKEIERRVSAAAAAYGKLQSKAGVTLLNNIDNKTIAQHQQ